jgi:ferrous iron transport protein B
MSDQMKRKGISLDIETLEKQLDTKIALISTRENEGIAQLKSLILNYRQLSTKHSISLTSIDQEYFQNLEKAFPNQSLYKLWLVITQGCEFSPK